MSGEFATILLVGFAILTPLVALIWISARSLAGLEPGKRCEFALGAVGIVALNMGLYLALSLSEQRTIALAEIPVWLPWIANLAPVLILAFVRRWVAIGALAVIGFLLAWAFLAGVLFFMGCVLVGVYISVFGTT